MSEVSVTTDQLFAAYLAGFFDGEGCVSVCRHGGYPYLKVTIAQKCFPILEKLSERFGGRVDKQGTCWYWSLNTAAPIKKFLTYIQPHLVLKLDEVNLAIAFCEHWPAGHAATPKQQLIREKIADQLQQVKDSRREIDGCQSTQL